MKLNIVIFGLSITSSWGNGHATTYRALVKALSARGHKITFLERDVPWYRQHRDLRNSAFCRIELYRALRDVPPRFGSIIAGADLVIVGSYVPDGAILSDWVTTHARGVTAFYDIDTPVTLAKLARNDAEYIGAAMIPRFDLYLSFTGGPALRTIEDQYGSPRARPLYCSVDPQLHAPVDAPLRWALGYLGTYSVDRQGALEKLLLEQARRMPDRAFVVAGAQFPDDIAWPSNVERMEHLPPKAHPEFYCSQQFTLNITRSDMLAAGFSPSVRLFEAAACGVPVISDRWPGLDAFFKPGEEVLIADSATDVMQILRDMPDHQRRAVAAAGRKRVIHNHTSEHRAIVLEQYYCEAVGRSSTPERAEAVA